MGTSLFHGPWLWYGTAIGVAAAAISLLLWALLWDRSRGRLRCPRCWYDMSAAASPSEKDLAWKCPECGRSGRGVNALQRARRRRGWAAVALLLLAGAWLLMEQPMIRQRGWMWLAPTWMLVHTLPIEGPDGVTARELQRRLGRNPWPNGDWATTLSDAQVASLFEICVEGTWLARPVDERWCRSFGPFVRQDMVQVYYQRVRPFGTGKPISPPLTGENLERAKAASARLAQLHGPLLARTRSRWPRGIPIHIEVPVEMWWEPESIEHSTHVRWKVEGTETAGDSWCSGYTEIKVPAEGHVRLRVDVDWVEGRDAPSKDKVYRVLASDSRVLEYDVVATIDDALTPASSPALDAGVASSLVLDHRGFLDGMTMRGARSMLPADVSFGLRIEYVLDGAVVGTSHCRYVGGASLSGTMDGPNFPEVKTWEEAQKILQNPGLKMRIATDPAWALANIDATRYWKGATVTPPPETPQK